MWNAHGKNNAPGQMARYDSTKSGANMPSANANWQSIGNAFSDLYADDASRNRKAEVLNWSSSVQNAPSSMQNINQNVNPPYSFVRAPAVFDGNFGGSQFSHSQTNGVFGNQIHQSAQENIFTSQRGTDSIYSVNGHSASSQAFDMNFQKGTTGNPMHESFPQKETSSTNNAAIVEIPRLPYSQNFTYNVLGPSEVNNSQSATSTTGNSGSIQGGFILKDGMNRKYSASFLGGNMYMDPSVVASNEPILTNELLPDSAAPDKKFHIQDLKKTESTNEHAKNNNILDFARSINALLHQTNFIVNSVSAAERGDSDVPSMNELRSTNDHSSRMPRDPRQQDCTRSAGEPTVGVPEGMFGVVNTPANTQDQDLINNTGIHKCPGTKDYNMLTGHSNQPTLQSGSPASQPNVRLDREGKSINGNSISMVAAKIWDGTIQLNTSTTIAAIAFFKSGEKALEINWPNFIEVKGKVRLEAFEKFVQELPRSRSRALMVTSICWKVGTSETGLTGIKEVGKGYKDGQRVGFAHLCTGTDLYVCPRSENIITILAKYGFFKGMAVVEEDQDSLIGCVVWRRNPNTNVASKGPDSEKTHPDKILDSPSESGLQAVINSNSTETQDRENTPAAVKKADPALATPPQVDPVIVPPSQAVPTSRESESASQTQIVPSTMNQIEIVPSDTSLPSMEVNVTSVSVESVKTNQNIPLVPAQLSFNNYSSSPQQIFTAVSCTEAALSPVTIPKKSPIDASDQKSTFSGAVWLPHGAQACGKGADDDDLPEFDFYTACGRPISDGRAPWPNQQGFVSAGQNAKHTPESHQQGYVLTGQNVMHTSPVDGGSEAQPGLKLEVASLQAPVRAVPTHVHPGTPLQVTVMTNSFDRNGAGQMAEKSHNPAVRENEISVKQPPNMYPKRALWDDDDMPEWCPPVLGQVRAPPLPQAPPPPTPPSLLSRHPPELDHQCQLPPQPPLLRMPDPVRATGLPYPINNQTSELLSRAPFPSNPPEQGRGLSGQEPTSHIQPFPTKPVSSANYQFERRHSPGRTFNNAPRHPHGFDMKHDRRPFEPNHNETSKRQHCHFYRREQSPRERPGDAQFYHQEPSPRERPGDAQFYHREQSPRERPGDAQFHRRESSPRERPGDAQFHRRESSPRERPGDAQFYRREQSPRERLGDTQFYHREQSPRERPCDTHFHRRRHSPREKPGDTQFYRREQSPREGPGDTQFYHRERSPRERPGESSRRRSTGFDVLPGRSKTSPPRRSRRRPSLFDVKPDSYHSSGRR